MDLKEAILFAQDKFRAKGITSASLDAEVLLLEATSRGKRLRRDKNWMYMNLNGYALSQEEEDLFRGFVKRREKDEPIAYIVNRKEFYGLDFFVDKNVLIPRPETEVTVDNSLRILETNPRNNFTLLDIGTGSGCIAIGILDAAKRSGLRNIKNFLACDISHEAIMVAKRNAKRHGLLSKIKFLECDLAESLPKIRGCENVIITANLPYISYDDYAKLGPNVKRYEPRLALTTKDDGLYHIHRLLDNFALYSHYFRSFHLFLEADPKQMKAIGRKAKSALGDIDTSIIRDIRNKQRVIEIRKI